MKSTTQGESSAPSMPQWHTITLQPYLHKRGTRNEENEKRKKDIEITQIRKEKKTLGGQKKAVLG